MKKDNTNSAKAILNRFISKDKQIDFMELSCFLIRLIGNTDIPPGVRIETEYSKAKDCGGGTRMSLTFFANNDNAHLMFFESKNPEIAIQKYIPQFAAALNFIAGDYDLEKVRKFY